MHVLVKKGDKAQYLPNSCPETLAHMSPSQLKYMQSGVAPSQIIVGDNGGKQVDSDTVNMKHDLKRRILRMRITGEGVGGGAGHLHIQMC